MGMKEANEEINVGHQREAQWLDSMRQNLIQTSVGSTHPVGEEKGTFHTLMSWLGCTVYRDNRVRGSEFDGDCVW